MSKNTFLYAIWSYALLFVEDNVRVCNMYENRCVVALICGFQGGFNAYTFGYRFFSDYVCTLEEIVAYMCLLWLFIFWFEIRYWPHLDKNLTLTTYLTSQVTRRLAFRLAKQSALPSNVAIPPAFWAIFLLTVMRTSFFDVQWLVTLYFPLSLFISCKYFEFFILICMCNIKFYLKYKSVLQ